MKTYLGIDVGTTGVKACIFDVRGNLKSQSFVPSKRYYPVPGQVEQKPAEMLAETVRAVKGVTAGLREGTVAAMALDGQMAGLMAIDENWNPVTHYDSWLDTRCSEQVAEMNRRRRTVIEQAGSAPGFFFGPKLLWWKDTAPEIYKKCVKFIEPSAFIAGKFAGLKADAAFMDYTYIHFTNLADNHHKAWSTELCSYFDVPEDKLPEIISPTRLIGTLTESYAEATGLEPGIPIAAGCGDTAAGLLGAGLVVPGESVDTAGTASVLTFCSTEFRPDVEKAALLSCRSVVDGLWYSLAYINGGGLCIEWFADQFGAASEQKASVFEKINRQAAAIPVGSEGLIFCPHYAGRNFPYEPNLKGSWAGLDWKHEKAHLYRSILEGIAFEYRHYLKNFNRLYPDLTAKRIKAIGGGSKSPLFCGIKADCLNIPYAILPEREFGTLGSALIAAAAVGDIQDLPATVLDINAEFETLFPDPVRAEQYDACFRDYEQTIDGLITIFNQRNSSCPDPL